MDIPPTASVQSPDVPPVTDAPIGPPVRAFVPLIARVVNGTFGGGSTILGVFQRELVERRGWLTGEQYGLCFAVARITPGTSILAFCAAVGWFFGRTRGAMLALLAGALPCAAIALGMLLAYEQLQSITWFAIALRGAMASAIGVMLAAGWSIMRPYLKGGPWLRHAAVFLAGLLLMTALHFSPLSILGMAALLGFLLPEAPVSRSAKEPGA